MIPSLSVLCPGIMATNTFASKLHLLRRKRAFEIPIDQREVCVEFELVLSVCYCYKHPLRKVMIVFFMIATTLSKDLIKVVSFSPIQITLKCMVTTLLS